MLIYIVQLPLGKVRVELDRKGLKLADRGGFNAHWVNEEGQALSELEYLQKVKTYLEEIFFAQEMKPPSTITLNLAAHQLMDDLKGWSKLNYSSQFVKPKQLND